MQSCILIFLWVAVVHATKIVQKDSVFEEKIRALELSYARRIHTIETRLERLEDKIALKLERAQLRAERIEHLVHMVWIETQKSIEASEGKNSNLEMVKNNFTESINHLESIAKDGLALANATRRELADAVKTLSRRSTAVAVEALVTKRLNEKINPMERQLREISTAQHLFLDSCHRIQRNEATIEYQLRKLLSDLIDSFTNKTVATYRELNMIQTAIHMHDAKMTRSLSMKPNQIETAVINRLESILRNITCPATKEVTSLTEKLIELTDRADRTIQKFEKRLGSEETSSSSGSSSSNVIGTADELINRLNKIGEEDEEYGDYADEDT